MMDMTNNSTQFIGKSSDAIAIFKNDDFSYSTKPFDFFLYSLNITAKKRFKQQLRDVCLALEKSGKTFAKKRMALTPAGKKRVNLFVYLLNTTGSKHNCILVLVDKKGLPAISPTSRPNQISAKNINNQKLSPVFSKLIGKDPYFKTVLLKAQKAAKSDYPVLIEGESGTGKEILAQTIHKTSGRRNKKFVDINCAAIPEQLIDSELFGYEKGAFTGATAGGRHGLFIDANQGTLFLDEIADASLQTQAKLLRVLNEGYFKRVGGTKNIEVDVRIISATNKDLSQLIKDRLFREDLHFRLNTIPIRLPPLRERPKDIPLLINFFLKQHSETQRPPLNLSENCLEILKSYHWPGNVRELKGVVDYMVTMTTDSLITQNHLPDFLLSSDHRRDETVEHQDQLLKIDPDIGLLSTAVQQTEKKIISEVLYQAKNRSEAIRMLGISRRTFYTKLKQYNLA